jgi:transcription-repair coupling factor (superfamily II helicase)
LQQIQKILSVPGVVEVSGAPGGFDALVLAQVIGTGQGTGVFVARDDIHLARMAEALAFFAPHIERLEFPAWDCLPYDRASPNSAIVGQRIDTLTRLLEPAQRPRALLTTVSALLQRVVPRETFAGATLSAQAGAHLAPDALIAFLVANGYGRSETVMEAGEFAIRGGIIDVFPSGGEHGLRLDFFGDELDTIRTFDPIDQRTIGKLEQFVIRPISEVSLSEAGQARFRTGYRALFGSGGSDDPLYEAVSSGHRHIGMEHWLPLFHEKMETLLDYVPAAPVLLDHQWQQALDARLDLVAEYYIARKVIAEGKSSEGVPYHPVPPEMLFLDLAGWDKRLSAHPVGRLSPFAAPEGEAEGAAEGGGRRIHLDCKAGRDFAEARLKADVNVFDALAEHLADQQKQGRRVLLAGYTRGSLERLETVMREHGLSGLARVDDWPQAKALSAKAIGLGVLGLERGFVTDDLCVIGEQDILGDRLSHAAKRKIRPENFIAEASSLHAGDLVVHVEHGIARYDGLEAIDVSGAPHDCLRLLYDGGDKLFLPVENIELISRYGSEEAGGQLDRLGGAGWQARKARMKERIKGMAEELIKVAAARTLLTATRINRDEGPYDEFAARFPYEETDDQRAAIEDVLEDLSGGRSADRLICGDVGFGKTEVALRAAFVTAMSGKQVALVVPTTLLCRQHFHTFQERFKDFPVRVEQISRMVSTAHVRDIKVGMESGVVDIVIGTHALLAKDVAFRDLGLLIVDEEQHFGVSHKEQLKKLKADVHVLTLTATPIPRTLQLALTGVKEMSIIATPPVDRLAVRTFVLPFDPVVVREAIMRERFRGGQTFYVCPRVADMAKLAKRLKELVPEVKVVRAHGQMAPNDLEDAISAFYDGKYDVLLSTNIIESGIDMPHVNTMIIHRADMFGLAQLYQLRGRVGRSKIRAYAYLTLPERKKLTPAAEKRLEVMQTLDNLGAGFSLASHDLDIRGAGNLLGDEQSGHIREVGIELYQAMLEEAVAAARGLDAGPGVDADWSPQIGIGSPVLIPESYVSDLNVRMELYRRLSRLVDAPQIEAFAAELIDRFGSLPGEVENLLDIVAVKQLSKRAGVDKVDAGPKGAVISFRNNEFANPGGLVAFISDQVGTAKLRPDHKLVLMRAWESPKDRLAGVRLLMRDIAKIAEEAPAS